MSRLLLDTSAYPAMRRGDERLFEPIREASAIFLTSVVIGELVYGFVAGRLEAQNRRLLGEFLQSERVEVLSVDEETGERYAVIRHHLRRQGTPIPTNDLWIAASAAQTRPEARDLGRALQGCAADSRAVLRADSRLA